MGSSGRSTTGGFEGGAQPFLTEGCVKNEQVLPWNPPWRQKAESRNPGCQSGCDTGRDAVVGRQIAGRLALVPALGGEVFSPELRSPGAADQAFAAAGRPAVLLLGTRSHWKRQLPASCSIRRLSAARFRSCRFCPRIIAGQKPTRAACGKQGKQGSMHFHDYE